MFAKPNCHITFSKAEEPPQSINNQVAILFEKNKKNYRKIISVITCALT